MPCMNLAPMLVDRADFNIDTDGLQATGFFENVQIDGLNTFITRNIHMGLINLRITFDFLIPEIVAVGFYGVNGHATFGFNGEGPFRAAVHGLTLVGHAQLGIRLLRGTLELREFRLVPDVDSISLQMDGLAASGLTNDFLNAFFERLLVELLQQNQEQITDTIEEIAIAQVNDILGEMTLQDLLDAIRNGSGEGDGEPAPPCELIIKTQN